jgi:outer membrane protein assembly factor BamB
MATLRALVLLLPFPFHPWRSTAAQDWPSYRGPSARGVAEGHALAERWDVAKGEHVLWRTQVAGLAHSAPVIAGDRVFLSSAVREGAAAELKVGLYGDPSEVESEGEHDFVVLALDQRTGKVLWERTAWSGTPKFSRHPKSSYAASTPATDGAHVVVHFGTEGLYCFDPEGQLLWEKDLGDCDAGPYNMAGVEWGYASSPVIHEGRLLVQCDVLSQGFVAAFDVATGAELWRTKREEVSTWATPTVDVREGRSQVICNGFKHIGGYDLATGKELWKLEGGGDIPVPTPVIGDGLIYVTNAHGRMAPMLAIDALAEGKLALEPEDSPHLRWSDLRRGNYMQTPLVLGEFLYACNDSGVLRCFDAAGGEVVYENRLGDGVSGFTSSPVAADGKLYFASEEGVVYVVAEGFEFALLAKNALGAECMATPAISQGVLYYRTRGHLTAVGAK